MNPSSERQIRACPFCGETILAVAIRCKHCQSDLSETEKDDMPTIVDRKVPQFSKAPPTSLGGPATVLYVMAGIGQWPSIGMSSVSLSSLFSRTISAGSYCAREATRSGGFFGWSTETYCAETDYKGIAKLLHDSEALREGVPRMLGFLGLSLGIAFVAFAFWKAQSGRKVTLALLLTIVSSLLGPAIGLSCELLMPNRNPNFFDLAVKAIFWMLPTGLAFAAAELTRRDRVEAVS
ncbi:MAG: hypothetical protein RL653_1018 [Pseudomonadota bacterium]|jgi:hypothetical protein